jgi:hypothetical protein
MRVKATFFPGEYCEAILTLYESNYNQMIEAVLTAWSICSQFNMQFEYYGVQKAMAGSSADSILIEFYARFGSPIMITVTALRDMDNIESTYSMDEFKALFAKE